MTVLYLPARQCAGALLLLASTSFGAVSAESFPAGATIVNQDSVSYQIDAAHSGTIHFDKGFSAALAQSWSANLGGVVSYPITHKGTAYVTVGMGSSVLLEALSLTTGAVEWEKLLPGSGGWADAAYDNGNIFVVNSTGTFIGFAAVSGKKLWSVQLQGPQYYETAYSAPVAHEGIVVEQYVNQSGVDTVAGFDETTGAAMWTFAPSYGYAVGQVAGAAAIDANAIYLSNSAGTYALSPPRGSLLWSEGSSCAASDIPVVRHTSILVSRQSCNGNTIYDLSSGAANGTFTGAEAPVVAAKGILVSLGGTLYDYSPRNYNVYWTFSPGNGSTINTKPIIINDHVAALSNYGNLYILDDSNGQLLWSTTLSGSESCCYSGPDTGLGAGEGMLLVPYVDTLYAFAPKH